MEVLFSLELTESSKQTAFRNSAATPAMAWTHSLYPVDDTWRNVILVHTSVLLDLVTNDPLRANWSVRNSKRQALLDHC